MRMNTLKFKNKKKIKESMDKRGLILIALFLVFTPLITSADYDHIISNSDKWTDVYSVVHFGNLQEISNDFLVSTAHGPLLLNGISKERTILVVSSTNSPQVFNYPDMIRAREFAGVEEISGDNINTELINELPDIENFVILSDSFGYNALAVAPYAIQTNSWVFFANRENIYEIDSILSKRKINKILVYGFLEQQIIDIISEYNIETINTGNRFEDNIAIVEKFLKIKPMKQVVLTNGEFIEKEIMAGSEPVLFTGKENVPSQISTYLKNSDFEVGVLIGNDLVGAATNIRRDTGLSVMVKFARSARAPTGGVAPVEGLDLYPVPTPNMQLDIHSIKYNQASSQLEVTYISNSNIPIYFKGTITIDVNGVRKKVGDLEAIFIGPGDYKTVIYSMELALSGEEITAEIYTLYGETPASLEKILNKQLKVTLVNVIDACKLDVKDISYVKYSKQKQSIIVKVNNPHKVDCWIDLEIIDILIGYSKKTIGLEGSVRIPAEKNKKIEINQDLTDADLEKNNYVKMTVYSGEREDSLVHILTGQFKLEVESLAILTYAIITLAIIIIVLIIIIIIVKKKQREEYY